MANDNDDVGEKTAVIHRDAIAKEMQKAKESEACLIIVRGNPQGSKLPLLKTEMIIGRDPSVEISIVADANISRKHVKLTKLNDGTVSVTDLGSSNGTFLNDRKLVPGEAVNLSKEDMLKVGSTVLKFLPAG